MTNAIEQDGTAKLNDRPSMQSIGAQQHGEIQRPSANANHWCTIHCHRRVIMIIEQLTGTGMAGDGQ